MSLQIEPLTPERWGDFEELFGARGACGGCWCMWFRKSRREFERDKGERNRREMRDLVAAGKVPGLLAYRDGRPAGWCAVAPRQEFPLLLNSRILRPIDDRPAWALVCFFVARGQRRSGVSRDLIHAAVAHAAANGAAILEAYPVEPKKETTPDIFAYHGFASSFRSAGFSEVAWRSPTRPVMRRTL